MKAPYSHAELTMCWEVFSAETDIEFTPIVIIGAAKWIVHKDSGIWIRVFLDLICGLW